MKKHYIQAVLELVRKGKSPDEVISGLVTLLEAKGHKALFVSVLKGVLHVIEAESERTGAVVIVANRADEQKYADAIREALKAMGASESYALKEDDTLIGGFIAEANNIVHDESHKAALVNLYRKLTS